MRFNPTSFNPVQFAENAAVLPEISYYNHQTCGAIALQRGVHGFHQVDAEKFPLSRSDPAAFVRQQNTLMGITPSVAEAMLFGSMFGWDKGGAHPSVYTRLDHTGADA